MKIFMVQKNHQNDRSVGSTPFIWFTFPLRGQLQGSVSVRSMKVSTNQWHHYGSVHLAIFDHLWMFEIVSELNSVERTNSEEADGEGERISEKREKGAMITLILSLLPLFLICETWEFHQNITWKTTEKINCFGFLLIENLGSDVSPKMPWWSN